jgi:hypothetical protein
MNDPIFKITACKEASFDWFIRVLLLGSALSIPSLYVHMGGGSQVFESGDWLFVMALPACALYLALNYIALDERRIAHVIGFCGYGIHYGEIAWDDVALVELRSSNGGRNLKLAVTASTGRHAVFMVPSNSKGASKFREIVKYFDERSLA